MVENVSLNIIRRKDNLRSTPILFISLLLFLSGCQTATLQNAGTDAASKKFVAELGKAKIYVYRLSGLAGVIRVEPVFVDGRMLGHNGPGTFLTLSVSPGQHTVSTTASSISIHGEGGGVYFVKQKMSAWGPTSSVENVSTADGEHGVALCSQAVSLY